MLEANVEMCRCERCGKIFPRLAGYEKHITCKECRDIVKKAEKKIAEMIAGRKEL